MADEFPVQVAASHGHVPGHVLDDAATRVRRLSRLAPSPVMFARVAVGHEDNPAVERPVVVKATLDVNGRPVRAHVAAEEFLDALDLMEDRLRHGLEIMAEHRHARRVRPAETGSEGWRHGDPPTARPAHHPRPPEDRELVRRKSYALWRQSVDEAALDLDLLDHDWQLFTEERTGHDAVLVRDGDAYRLLVAGDHGPELHDTVATVAVRSNVPTLAVADAIEQLDVSDAPFVFFVDAHAGRGTVVYRRYDGHYGQIMPT